MVTQGIEGLADRSTAAQQGAVPLSAPLSSQQQHGTQQGLLQQHHQAPAMSTQAEGASAAAVPQHEAAVAPAAAAGEQLAPNSIFTVEQLNVLRNQIMAFRMVKVQALIDFRMPRMHSPPPGLHVPAVYWRASP